MAGELQTAWRLLDAVAGAYRKEGWHVLLAGAVERQLEAERAAMAEDAEADAIAERLVASSHANAAAGGGERAR